MKWTNHCSKCSKSKIQNFRRLVLISEYILMCFMRHPSLNFNIQHNDHTFDSEKCLVFEIQSRNLCGVSIVPAQGYFVVFQVPIYNVQIHYIEKISLSNQSADRQSIKYAYADFGIV